MKMRRNKWLLVYVLFLVFSNNHAQINHNDIKAKIEIEESENILKIIGTAENSSDVYKSLYYKLTVFNKSNKEDNQVSNVQEGYFTLDPNQKKILSKTQINTLSKNQTILLLLIYDEKTGLIGKDRVVLEAVNTNPSIDKTAIDKPNDGLEMVGIISNETKTKLGNDFYDYFYTYYNKIKINSPKIVTIEEELTFARTTKITVKIDNEIINEFISKPDEEFMSYMAEDSANKVLEYLKKIDKQSKMIMQY